MASLPTRATDEVDIIQDAGYFTIWISDPPYRGKDSILLQPNMNIVTSPTEIRCYVRNFSDAERWKTFRELRYPWERKTKVVRARVEFIENPILPGGCWNDMDDGFRFGLFYPSPPN